jgi:hypothetical protein
VLSRYVPRGGFNAVLIRLRLSNGKIYDQTGHLNFADNTITTNTDTITLRGEIGNPPIQHVEGSGTPTRELFDGEFVIVLLEGVQPTIDAARGASGCWLSASSIFANAPNRSADASGRSGPFRDCPSMARPIACELAGRFADADRQAVFLSDRLRSALPCSLLGGDETGRSTSLLRWCS